ncbi:hypothetical protein LLEC1_04594 [Akanthomyces lecanii]|uniref:Uncharacterized protein n=1 Tax=Cordyceps confragosa TaxID=2714763 RepID=A0A179IBG0_CORDF|nr:hypothetical protein LLEC1_04594 [Akanthomyces lecanii]
MVFSQLTNATFLPFASLAALLSTAAVQASRGGNNAIQALGALNLPAQAQAIDSARFASMPSVAAPSEYNGTTIWVPPGTTRQGLRDRPFLVFDPELLEIIGHEPKLAVVAESEKDPLFHEAVVWVETVTSDPPVINPNVGAAGGTNYKGNMLFAGEGMGNKTAPALYSVNPLPPHNATVLVSSFYGRQFNSLNDVGVNPRNAHVYFTDPLYGYLQGFRPPPALPVQVYRLDPETMAVTVAADGFDQANGKLIFYFLLRLQPSCANFYRTHVLAGWQIRIRHRRGSEPRLLWLRRSSSCDHNRMTFAFADNGVPDGIHCDSKGNVYAGCGDGIHVWNPSGKLLGKIFTDGPAANFQFAGDGKLVICAETRLYLALVAAKAAPIH